MKTPYEYRAYAREVLQSRWGDAAVIAAAILAATTICSLPSLSNSWWGHVSSLLSLLMLPLSYSFSISLLKATRQEEEKLLDSTLSTTKNMYSNLFVVGVLYTVIIAVLSVLTLGIAGVIFSYAYRMVPYLMYDYPELTPREAMKISREMMSGQKWELFVLDLSFIGWILAALLTAGLGMIFVEPYMSTARAAFYEDLKGEKLIEETDETTTATAE
jgi:uncharacterized membrane protein